MRELLLLHGALGSEDQFKELAEQLSGTFRTHALNFSSHGRRPSHHHAFTIQNFTHEVLDWMNERCLQKNKACDFYHVKLQKDYRFKIMIPTRKETEYYKMHCQQDTNYFEIFAYKPVNIVTCG